MKSMPMPKWMQRAREFSARVKSPAGAPFAAKKSDKVAKLYLYDAIGRDFWGDGISPQDVVTAINDAEDAETLEVHINSPGGVIFDGIAIYTAIRSFAGEKVVHVDGVAASIASVIALAGDRVITNEGATWMIHEPWSGLYSVGTADEIEDDARKTVTALRKLREEILDIYLRNTGQSLSDLSAWMGAETWMSAAEAKERGFSDETAVPDEKEPEEKQALTSSPPSAASPRIEADLARAKARSLIDRFAAASRGAKPGQPGTTTQHPGTAGRTAR